MTDTPADGAEILDALRAAAAERILVLDGAMGTEIQALKLSRGGFPRRALPRPRARPARATTTF